MVDHRTILWIGAGALILWFLSQRVQAVVPEEIAAEEVTTGTTMSPYSVAAGVILRPGDLDPMRQPVQDVHEPGKDVFGETCLHGTHQYCGNFDTGPCWTVCSAPGYTE